MPATSQQQAVIDAHSGTILVKAGPGSGKTTTLANRCRALPTSDSKQILMFNAQARDDFQKKIGANSQTSVKTFHQFCMHELWGNPEPYGYRRGAKLLKNMGPFAQFKEANGLTGGSYEPRSWAEAGWDNSLVDWAESHLYTHEVIEQGKAAADLLAEAEKLGKFEQIAALKRELETYKAIYRHREWLKHTNQFTFGSVVRLMAEHRDQLRKAADHVMVDEFQDVDRFQFDIISGLARVDGTKSFTCVGDPNQLIYQWRGALPDSFERMSKEMSCEILLLTTNFRSKDEIISFADEICPIGMVGVRGSGGADCVRFFEPSHDDTDKNYLMGNFLNGNYYEHAILCRYNRDCAKWQIHLAKKGIPVHVMGRGDYWNTPHIKMAKEAWNQRMTANEFLASREWVKFSKQKQFRDEEGEEKLRELEKESMFIIELTSDDMRLLGDNFDNPRDGLKISTIHKTKGAEFKNVMVFGVDEKLKQDKFLYYVACTRAMDRMVIA